MIVLLKNNKVIGADTNLLNKLNANLDNLSSKISQLELILSSFNGNELIIDNYAFNVEEIPLISLENLKAYNLTESSNLKPQTEELLELEETLNTQPIIEEFENITKEFEPLNLEENLEEKKFEPLNLEEKELINQEPLFIKEEKSSHEEMTPIEEREIKISFESSLDEINEILSLNKEEANKLIAQELQKASQDLGIDYKTIHDLYLDLLKQIKEEKENLYNAIEKKDYENIHKIAHKLKGAALNLRLSKLAHILKYIDEESKAKKPIEEIRFLVDKFYNFVSKLETKNNKEIPESIKNLILLTIKDYLATQNEKKFKKDLKYIEKILDTKINSLEELQELVKD